MCNINFQHCSPERTSVMVSIVVELMKILLTFVRNPQRIRDQRNNINNLIPIKLSKNYLERRVKQFSPRKY